MEAIQTALFDYAELDTETRIVVQQRTSEIKALMKRAASDIIEIGQKLIEVKAKLGHGYFGRWLKVEFDWHWNTANNFMRVAEKFTNFVNLENVAPSALYLLAMPSTPESARIEAIARAEEGETITHGLARGIVADHRSPALPFVPEDDPLTDYEERLIKQYGDALYAPKSYADRPDRVMLPDVLDYIEQMPGAIEAIEKKIASTKPANHQLLNQSISNEWYTPREYTDAARELMGTITTDPASNDRANEWIGADVYYTKDTNGFDKPWHGAVWMNPPYGKEDGDSNQNRWTARLIDQYRAGVTTEAVCLVNAVPGNLWFAPLWAFPICFAARRIRFYSPAGELGDPTHSNVLVYLPDQSRRAEQIARFVRIFSQFGPVVSRLEEYAGQVFIHGLE